MTHYLISGMRYRIILLGEVQHLGNGELRYRTVEIEIGQIAPLMSRVSGGPLLSGGSSSSQHNQALDLRRSVPSGGGGGYIQTGKPFSLCVAPFYYSRETYIVFLFCLNVFHSISLLNYCLIDFTFFQRILWLLMFYV